MRAWLAHWWQRLTGRGACDGEQDGERDAAVERQRVIERKLAAIEAQADAYRPPRRRV